MSETPARGTGRKIAIVGGAPTRRLAPYDDESWDIWAFSSLRLNTPRVTRWFEMHAPGDLATQLTRSTAQRRSYVEYVRFLKNLSCPLVAQRRWPQLPHSVEYPLKAALRTFGRCFSSTVSYMIALALLEGCDVIGVWGVHLTAGTVYARQRPGVEYLLGVSAPAGCRRIFAARVSSARAGKPTAATHRRVVRLRLALAESLVAAEHRRRAQGGSSPRQPHECDKCVGLAADRHMKPRWEH